MVEKLWAPRKMLTKRIAASRDKSGIKSKLFTQLLKICERKHLQVRETIAIYVLSKVKKLS